MTSTPGLTPPVGWFVRAILAVLALLPLPFAACGGDSSAGGRGRGATLRFSAIPDDNETLLRERYVPVAAHLSEQLGVRVEYVPVSDYPAVVELFRNGDIQLAWFGGLSGVQARHVVAGARAIAQGARDPAFYSYFVAHRDTGLQRGDEFPLGLAGRRFTFGSRDSTSGRLMPEHFIREFTGRSPREFFGQLPRFAGSHDRTALAVQSGAFEAGALSHVTYDRMVAEGKIDPDVCRVVWRTPPYPDYNFTVHPMVVRMFGESFVDELQRVLLATGPEVTAAFDRERFVTASNGDFAVIVELAEQLEFIR